MNISLLSTAVFLSVTILHVLRLTYQLPMSIGDVSIPLWLSFFGVIAMGTLAWMNWHSAKRDRTDVLHLLQALFLIDILGLLVFQVEGIYVWGFTNLHYMWFILLDVVLFGITTMALKKK